MSRTYFFPPKNPNCVWLSSSLEDNDDKTYINRDGVTVEANKELMKQWHIDAENLYIKIFKK